MGRSKALLESGEGEMIKNGDLPAMPNNTDTQTLDCMGLMNTVADFYKHGAGLTKREQFAMAAMQGLCSDIGKVYDFCPNGEALDSYLARQAVSVADALLAEMERSK